MNHRNLLFASFVVLASAPLNAQVQKPAAPLTLAEAQRRAVVRSLQLTAQNAAASASREMAVAAGQLPDPALKFGLDNLPINGPDQFSVTRDFMTMRRIGVMQEFTREEKRQLRAGRFEREAEKLRMRPIAMTVAVIIAGLLPIMWGSGTGSEVMRRIAAPTVGGMITTPPLSMFVIPAVYLLLRRRRVAPSTTTAHARLGDETAWSRLSDVSVFRICVQPLAEKRRM